MCVFCCMPFLVSVGQCGQRAAVVSLTQSTPSFRPSSSNLLSSQMFLSPHQVQCVRSPLVVALQTVCVSSPLVVALQTVCVSSPLVVALQTVCVCEQPIGCCSTDGVCEQPIGLFTYCVGHKGDQCLQFGNISND